MSEQSTIAGTRAPASARGCVIVGDYLGQPAAAAARAVRRVGLTPGLDRQFGGEPQGIGLVVAQDPPAGSEAARATMVTLYVSAPATRMPEGEHDGRELLESEHDAPSAAVPASTVRPRERERPRRRKGRARAPGAPEHEAPAAPTFPELPAPEAFRADEEQLAERDGEDAAAGASETEPDWDQPAVQTADIFDTSAFAVNGPAVYPRMPVKLRTRAWREWLRSHRTLVVLTCVLLAVTAGLTVTRERAAHGPPHARTAARAARAHPVAAARASAAAPMPSPRAGHAVRQRRETHPVPSSLPAARAATSTAASAPIPPARDPAPAGAPANSEPAGQSGGGQFSP